MSKPSQIALMQAQPLPATVQDSVPDWIQLLPPGRQLTTMDGRGPYRVPDPATIVAGAAGQVLPIDENHAIDIRGPRGEPSPAVGRVLELQAREDGSIWGRAEWNGAGRQLLAERAYVGISPVITHDSGMNITGILRASLTNKPNLRGMSALQMETHMTTAIAKALGLAEDAGEEEILAAIGKLREPAQPQLQAQLGEIGVALGVAVDAAPEAIVAAARARGRLQPAEITALQAELTSVASELAKLRDESARAAAEAAVDAAIREGRVGLKPVRGRYIAMHMTDPAGTAELIAAMPKVTGPLPTPRAVATGSGEIALQAEQLAAARALALDPKTYAETLMAERQTEEAL